MKPYPSGDARLPAQPEGEVLLVVCMPVASGPAIPGSTQRNCALCAEPIWVSAATMRSVQNREPRRFVCVPCAMREMGDEQQLTPPSPEQIEELQRFLSKMEDGDIP